MPVVRLAVAACVLLVLTACGVPSGTREARDALPSLSAAAEQSGYSARSGITRSVGDEVTLSVSAPISFTPTEEAYPQAVRAVAFELVIDNQGTTAYRPAQLSFVATADGTVVDQVIDSTQGYSGVTGAVDEVLPKQTVRFSVAFGVPAQPCAVRVAVRPDSAAASALPIFDGTI